GRMGHTLLVPALPEQGVAADVVPMILVHGVTREDTAHLHRNHIEGLGLMRFESGPVWGAAHEGLKLVCELRLICLGLLARLMFPAAPRPSATRARERLVVRSSVRSSKTRSHIPAWTSARSPYVASSTCRSARAYHTSWHRT